MKLLTTSFLISSFAASFCFASDAPYEDPSSQGDSRKRTFDVASNFDMDILLRETVLFLDSPNDVFDYYSFQEAKRLKIDQSEGDTLNSLDMDPIYDNNYRWVNNLFNFENPTAEGNSSSNGQSETPQQPEIPNLTTLLKAAFDSQNINEFLQLAENGADIDAVINESTIPQMLAMENPQPILECFVRQTKQCLNFFQPHPSFSILEYILKNNLEPIITILRGKGYAPVLEAHTNQMIQDSLKCPEILERLLALSTRSLNLEHLLQLALNSGNIPTQSIYHLVASGAPCNIYDRNGHPTLYIAAENGHKDTVDLLLKNGAKVYLPNNNGATPLHTAAFQGHKDTVDLLLKNGANLEARDPCGGTPLYTAAQNGHKDTVDLLLKNGAKVDLPNNSGCTPLHAAAQKGRVDTMSLLLQHGANLEIRDTFGGTPLFLAALNNRLAVMSYLLDNGANKNISVSGNTIYKMALYNENLRMLELLGDWKEHLKTDPTVKKLPNEIYASSTLSNRQKIEKITFLYNIGMEIPNYYAFLGMSIKEAINSRNIEALFDGMIKGVNLSDIEGLSTEELLQKIQDFLPSEKKTQLENWVKLQLQFMDSIQDMKDWDALTKIHDLQIQDILTGDPKTCLISNGLMRWPVKIPLKNGSGETIQGQFHRYDFINLLAWSKMKSWNPHNPLTNQYISWEDISADLDMKQDIKSYLLSLQNSEIKE